MGKFRALPVPEGLDGMRVDAAMSKLFGVSRAVAAEIAANGDVLVNGTACLLYTSDAADDQSTV